MNQMEKLLSSVCVASNIEEFVSILNLERTLSTKAAFYILETKELLKDPNFTENQKTNERYALNVQKMIKAHIALMMFLMSKDFIEGYKF
jgi:hypothetical protein